MLFHHNSSTHTARVALAPTWDPERVSAYSHYYGSRNVWVRAAEPVLNTEPVRTSHMMCSRRELLRSEFYAGWLAPMEITHAIGATLRVTGMNSVLFAIMAGTERSDFEGEDRIFLGKLLPHLTRALQMRDRLEEGVRRERALTDAFDRLSAGVLLVSSHGRVLFMNAAARSLVCKGEGLIVDAAGLRAARSDDTARLRALIGGASQTSVRRARHSGGVMRVARPNGKPPLEVLVAPLRWVDDWPRIERAVAAVFVTDPSLAPPTAGVLTHLYGLTPREAKVLAVIATGASGKRAADELGVSYNTLKTHLRHIFMKTDTRSQAELVRLAQGGIAGLDLNARK